VRGFKSTPHCAFAKKKKGGSKGGKGGGSSSDRDDDAEGPAPPDVKEIEGQMDKRITRLKEEFSRMHNSRVSKEMFNNVMVEAYGSKSPVPECGQVSVQTASKVVINVFDASIVPAVTKALRDCGLNLNPIADGSVVSVPVPKASKEMREDMVKVSKKVAEKVMTTLHSVNRQSAICSPHAWLCNLLTVRCSRACVCLLRYLLLVSCCALLIQFLCCSVM
jgi:ribosome recycling factor